MNKKATTSLAMLLSLSFGLSAQNFKVQDISGAEKVALNENNQVTHIRFKADANVKKAQFFKTFDSAFKLSKHDAMQESKVMKDELGYNHTRYQQFHKGVEILGAEYVLHEKSGDVRSANGRVFKELDLDVSPRMDKSSAFQMALNHINADVYKWETADKMYSKPEGKLAISAKDGELLNENLRLVYRFDIYAEAPLGRYYVDVDAKTGEIVNSYNRIHMADTNGSGETLYNGNQNIVVDSFSGGYRLRQSSRGTGNGLETYDMGNGTSYSNATDVTHSSSNFGSTDPTAVQAHWGAGMTYDYFKNHHGRNSYDNSGTSIKSYVHYSSNYVNAYWNGSVMTYGDGNGTSYGPLVSLDIVGHEITHGVTEYTANLVYSRESGALNESFSDIFGEAIENYATGSNDWRMGKDIGINRDGALRSMSNPNEFGDPDTYKGSGWVRSGQDNGGVHTNSGVQNYWFYLLSQGGSGSNDNGTSYSVTGIGIADAGAIAYRNLAVYLTSSSQYSDARNGAIQAAIDLFGDGSQQHQSTMAAWDAVGVGGSSDGGGGKPGKGGKPNKHGFVGDVTYSLDQNFPNPFNPTTTINYSLEKAGHVNLTIYNIAGQVVAELVNTVMPEGSHNFTWDASNVASGVYIYTISTPHFTQSRKMILMK